MFTEEQLVKMTPFDDETSRDLLAALPGFSPAKKEQLRALCVDTLKQHFTNEWQFRLAVAKKKNQYQLIEPIQTEVIYEYVRKLGITEERELDDVGFELFQLLIF